MVPVTDCVVKTYLQGAARPPAGARRAGPARADTSHTCTASTRSLSIALTIAEMLLAKGREATRDKYADSGIFDTYLAEADVGTGYPRARGHPRQPAVE